VPVDRFLQYTAARNLADLLEVERRRQHRETRYVAERRAAPSIVHTFEDGREDANTRRRILSVAQGASERQALIQWLHGERSTASLAATLALAHLSQTEQRREVKRFKDRVLKRCRGCSRRRVAAGDADFVNSRGRTSLIGAEYNCPHGPLRLELHLRAVLGWQIVTTRSEGKAEASQILFAGFLHRRSIRSGIQIRKTDDRRP
jgi:hypothetical protein